MRWSAPIETETRSAYADWFATIGRPLNLRGPVPVVVILPGGAISDDGIGLFIDWLLDPAHGISVSDHDVVHWLVHRHAAPAAPSELIIAVSEGADPTLAEAAVQAEFEETREVDRTTNRDGRRTAPEIVARRKRLLRCFDDLMSRPDTPCRPPRVVTGVIDTGIPFLNARFCDGADRTRIAAHWSQDAARTTSTVAFGGEFSRRDIQGQIDELAQDGDLESAAYRWIERADRPHLRGDWQLLRARTHGAAILDLAAGGRDGAAAEMNPILTVDLPAQLVGRTNGFGHAPFVKTALNWLWYQSATEFALRGHPTTLIVNHSFADASDRRDGQGLFDADFQRRLEDGSVDMITQPAGNGFRDDMHAVFGPGTDCEDQSVDMTLPPGRPQPTFVQGWFAPIDGASPEAHAHVLPARLSITPPGMTEMALPPLIAGQSSDLLDGQGHVLGRVYLQLDRPDYPLPRGQVSQARLKLTLALAPTGRSATDQHQVAPSGQWRIALDWQGHGAARTFELSIERGDSLPGFRPQGQQARFARRSPVSRSQSLVRDRALRTTGSPIRREGTLNAHANAADTLVVGAAVAMRTVGRPVDLASYSAAGTVNGDIRAPHFVAVIEDSPTRNNTLASGTLSSTRAVINGTSAASALAARALVDAFLDAPTEIGQAGSGLTMRDRLIADLAPPPTEPDGSPSPRARTGDGCLPMRLPRRPWGA